ncbi:hypothetical protein Lal_00018648 [Lupinus albus]|nr:hypothetical protein Lal_00018648 [Lupinus albus]
MWRKDKFQMVSHNCGNGFLSVSGKFCNSNDVYHLINVYSPCNFREKHQLWSNLEQWKNSSSDRLWCFLGDFNSVRASFERRGCENHGRFKEMQAFDTFINKLNLLDLPLASRRFTWIKGDGRTKSRLDRFLISPEWALTLPSLIQKGLKRVFVKKILLLTLARF